MKAYARISTETLARKLADCLENIISMHGCLLGIEENARTYRKLLREARGLIAAVKRRKL